MVVGGQPEFIARKVIPCLEKTTAPDGSAIRVVRHAAWKTNRYPSDADNLDALMVVTDMISHVLSNAARAHARKLGIPCVPITRKWLETVVSLGRYGYRTPPPVATSTFQPAPEAPAPAPLPVAVPVVTAPAPQEEKEEVSRKYEQRLHNAVHTLAENPRTTNAMLSDLFGETIRSVLPEARKRLGIRSPNHGGKDRRVTVEPDTVRAACAEFGVPEEVRDATLAEYPSPAARNTLARAQRLDDLRDERPAPVPAAPPSAMETLREAVALLRSAMADAGIVSLSIDRDGSVRAEQVVTVRL
jgi:hypothetical protein